MSEFSSSCSSSVQSSDVEMEEEKANDLDSDEKVFLRPSLTKYQVLSYTNVCHVKPETKFQSLCNIRAEPSVTVSDIRSLTSKYQTLLAKATEEIQKLKLEKFQMEKNHNKLLKTNVELAEELHKLYSEQKRWKEVEHGMLSANEEFAEEVEKLYQNEDGLLKEKEDIIVKLKVMEEENEKLKMDVNSLESQKQKQNSVIKKMFTENLNLSSQLETLKKQERKEASLKQENDQLQLENDFLTTSQKSTSDRIHIMEKELEVLRKDLKEEKEKVKNLSAWKEQVVEKNQKLCIENDRLKLKSEQLESLVNEEVGDIDNILQTINLLQGTQL